MARHHVLAALPSFRADPRVIRILIEVLQRSADADLAFTLQLRDDLELGSLNNSGVMVSLARGGISS